MATNNEREFLGRDGTEQLVAIIKNIPAMPACTNEDNGKILRVVNGAASWEAIPNAEEASF